MADRDVIVHIIGDSSSYERSLKKSTVETARFEKSLKSVGRESAALQGARGVLSTTGGKAGFLFGSAAFIGAAGTTAVLKSTIKAASDLHEELSKTNVVFGQSAEQVINWSAALAHSFGLAQQQALQASGIFGSFFRNAGQGAQQASVMAEKLTELGADLASFNNTSVDDALTALRSGLSGEIEPLRRYQVFLTAAAVQQRALADTGKKSVKQLTEGEKILARYELILGQTGRAQGDFARTSDGLANQQRILQAQLKNTSAELGTNLMPLELKAVELTNKLLVSFQGAKVSALEFSKVDFDAFGNTFGLENLVDLLGRLQPLLAKTRAEFQQTVDLPAWLNPQGLGSLAGGPVLKPGVQAFGQPGFKPGAAPAVPLGPPVGLQNRWFDAGVARQLDRVQDVKTIRGQIDALNDIAAEIQKRIVATQDVTRRLNLEDQLVTVRRQRTGLADQLVADAQEAKRLAAARAQQAEATRLAQRTARQFRQLGLDAAGNEVTPGVGNLTKRVASISSQVAGTRFDTPQLETQLARFRKVLSDGLVPKDVRAKIKQMLDDINAQIRTSTQQGGPLTATTQLNATRILAGLGLGPDAERALRARLSHFNSAGVALAGSTAAAGSTDIVLKNEINLDGRAIGQSTTRYQQKRGRANPAKRRG